jgi:DHA1 family tetracycline resistance protein-like MFS transporter
MIFGLVVGALGLAALGLAPTGTWMIAAIFLSALWGLSMPTLQSLMTQRVSESEQGQLQGANMSVGSIAGVASPLFFGFVYAFTFATLPGASFLVAGAILLGAAGIAYVVATRHGVTPERSEG